MVLSLKRTKSELSSLYVLESRGPIYPHTTSDGCAMRFLGNQEPDPWFAARGMPDMLVPDWVKKNVVFIGTKQDGKFIPRATGFLVGFEDQQFMFTYVVTAEHVIAALQTEGHDIYCRFNRTDHGVEYLKVPPDYWYFHPNENERTDVALFGYIPHEYVEFNCQPLSGKLEAVATAEVMMQMNIGLGDEIFIVGLFKSHHGKQRNVPIIRIGNIAAMRDEPVWTEYCGFVDAYLIEARSIGGLSGSPVVVSTPPMRVVDGTIKFSEGRQFYLLGLMHGHFDIQNLTEDTVRDAPQQGGGINTGIGVVIPVEKIIETVNHPDVKKTRDKIVANLRKTGAKADVLKDTEAFVIQGPPPSSESSTHQEDFKRLLDAAARNQKPAGQT